MNNCAVLFYNCPHRRREKTRKLDPLAKNIHLQDSSLPTNLHKQAIYIKAKLLFNFEYNT